MMSIDYSDKIRHRIWSVGCAVGEEPYSMAILLADKLGDSVTDYEIRIYATDIDEKALNEARKGIFPQERLKNVKKEYVDKYFIICRDVLIYFKGELQNRITIKFHYALNNNGFIFFGKSESLLVGSKLFLPINKKWRIFERISAQDPL